LVLRNGKTEKEDKMKVGVYCVGDINLFSIKNKVCELPSNSFQLERELQLLIENNMETFFGVTFLTSEFTITNGRIDSLGIDENFCPVVFEYKRSQNENVISQGLFYLDWLLDHKAAFELLVMKNLGGEMAKKVDWSVPCVICIASDFTKFDAHAVNQMQRNIKLIKYKKFGDELILFEQINSPAFKVVTDTVTNSSQLKKYDKTFEEQLKKTSAEFRNLYFSIRDYILSLGDDITENPLKKYCAYKKIKNIICVEIRQKSILLFLKLNPDNYQVEQEEMKIRDVRGVGHWGTGDLEVTIGSAKDFECAKYLIEESYNRN